MHTARFEVLSPDEVPRIHAASLAILAEIGIKVDYPTARAIFRSTRVRTSTTRSRWCGCRNLVMRAVASAPRQLRAPRH